jgi:hypothetical protein
MELRRAGEYTTYDTRWESHEKVDKQKRYEQIMEILFENGDLTAKEVAVIMFGKGYTPTSERGWSAPRLTEMSQKGIVEPIGKKVDAYTGKKVAVYTLLNRDYYQRIWR